MKIVDIIKYEGDNTTFIWKHPAEDFNTMTQLIVHESQEALLFLNGQALDLYGPGRHTLNTQNIPLLRRIVNIPTGGESPFHCEVYFINKTEQMAVNWGMGNVNYMDPVHNDYPFVIGASGEMSLKICDSRKIILKLVGTTASLDQETIKKYFKGPITMHIKTMLPNILRENMISIFDVENDLSGLSDILKKRISAEMADYGVSLEKFWISTILKPENDPTYKLLARQRAERVTLVNQGEIDAQRAAYEAKAGVIRHGGEVKKKKMDIDTQRYEQEQLGFTYQQRRGFDVMEEVAQNEGTGSDLRNAAMGLGIGFGAGGAFGQAMTDISQATGFSSLTTPVTPAPTVSEGKSEVPGMISLKDEESKSEENEMEVFQKKVKKLQMMKESGLLTEEEFNKQKKALLESL